MKYLYFDLIGGISGDMIAASLLDLTKGQVYLKKELGKINLKDYKIRSFKRRSGHIMASCFSVDDLSKTRRVLQFDEIKKKINGSRLKREVKDSIIKVYTNLYEAEKKVHGSGHAHFDQIGEIDSLIDIASACILIEKLNVDRIIYSSVPFGERVAMATTCLLKNKDIRLSKHPYENITPTGVAVITALGMQVNNAMNNQFIIKDTGYGAGSVQIDGFSNMLRVVVAEGKSDFQKDEIVVAQCNVDDMNPQVLGYLMERLYNAGALEVYFESCYTKKSRLGILISVLSKPDTLDKIARIIFKETTTLGIRYFKADRLKLERKEYILKNSLGKARVKEAKGHGYKKFIPEYDDCVKIAKSKNIALKDVLAKFSGGK